MTLIIINHFRKERGKTVELPLLLNPEGIATVIEDKDFFAAVNENDIPIIGGNTAAAESPSIGYLLHTRNNQKFVVKESLQEIKALADSAEVEKALAIEQAKQLARGYADKRAKTAQEIEKQFTVIADDAQT